MVLSPEIPKHLLKEILRLYSSCSAIGPFLRGTALAAYRQSSVHRASAVRCPVGETKSVLGSEPRRGRF